MEKKKLRRRCSYCTDVFTVGVDGDYLEDPFLAEIHDIYEKSWMCDDCYQQRRDDI